MIIETDFKDYYDYLAHQYRDNRTVYKRKTKNVVSTANKNLQQVVDWHTFKHCKHSGRLNNLADIGGVSILIIGSLVFPFRTIYKNGNYAVDWKDPYVDARQERKKFDWIYRDKVELKSGDRYDWASALCTELDAPVILIDGESRSSLDVNDGGWKYRARVTLNPILKDYSPPIHIFEVYQAILAQLQSVTPHIPVPSNGDKIEGHGFDVKRSFRPKMKG